MAKDVRNRSKAVSKREPGETNRVPVGFRISPTLRRQLEEAANKTGRSLSQEAEHRLEMTFETDGVVREALALAYGEEIARSMFTFADTLRTTRTVREMRKRGAIDEAGAKLMREACEQGLIGLVKKHIDETGGE
jgi:hypothetical protein